MHELKFMFSIKKYIFSSNHYSFLGYYPGCYYFLYRQKLFFFEKNTWIRLENFDEIYIYIYFVYNFILSVFYEYIS